jgi:thiol:disulfide interchange protein
MGFDPCNHSLKIRESIGTTTPKLGSSLGSVSVHPHILSHFWVSLLACVIASPCFGRKPKAKVVTLVATILVVIGDYYISDHW